MCHKDGKLRIASINFSFLIYDGIAVKYFKISAEKYANYISLNNGNKSIACKICILSILNLVHLSAYRLFTSQLIESPLLQKADRFKKHFLIVAAVNRFLIPLFFH